MNYFGDFMKIREDIDITDIEHSDDTEDYDDYVCKTTYQGSPFWIVYDSDGFKEYLGISSNSDFEDYLDEIFDNSWGYSDSWETCSNCGVAIWLDDFYRQDYWADYDGSCGWFCSDCVREEPEVRDRYIHSLINNPDACNDFLSDRQLEEAGLIKLEDEYESGYYGRNDSPKQILDGLLEKYPNGKFIFNLYNTNRWSTTYGVWAFEGYDEGAIEDEEE